MIVFPNLSENILAVRKNNYTQTPSF